MTNPTLALEGVSYALPDGRVLFSHLDEKLDQRRTGLVGRNGAGKSVLAGILAGHLQPSSGRCVRLGRVYYLAPQVSHPSDTTVAGLAGVQGVSEALDRIEAGGTAPEDFDVVNDRWDLRQRLQQALQVNGLGHLHASTPASTLSGGEAMRVALMGAMLSDANYLILDEPSNHLDRPHRQALIEQLRRWPHGLLVISHDRQLLQVMDRILELSSLGLHSYGGNYAFYAQCKAQERQNALQLLEQRKLERRHEETFMREQRERQARRVARGKRLGQEANQAKILLDRQKERSENSTGKLQQVHASAREHLATQVREAAQRVENDAPIALHTRPVAPMAKRSVIQLDAVVLPFVAGATRALSLTLTGQQRVGVIGPNGCGKSTLLKVLAGQLVPLAGTCKVRADCVYLDQQLAHLAPQRSVLEQVLEVNRVAGHAQVRMWLAQLGLDALKIMAPSGALSAGERLKAALACALYAQPPAQLLLLDEPCNHLDLAAVQALETMLRGYPGALVVVSHDDSFLNAIGLTCRLRATQEGWQLDAVAY